MVKKVMVPRYAAGDGVLFKTREAAQLHDWWKDPVDVEPINVKYRGGTHDLRGNLWSWSCGRCKKPAASPIDTVLLRTSATCQHCGAGNLFDFSKHKSTS